MTAHTDKHSVMSASSTPTTTTQREPQDSRIHWSENGLACSALWRSERGAAAPKSVVIADDSTTADAAYRLACAGTALLWRGDFYNARQLLQALVRRIDKAASRKKRPPPITAAPQPKPAPPGEAFHLHRMAQSQRARILSSVLLPFNADYSVALRRAPEVRIACTEAWGDVVATDGDSVATLRDLLGMTSAHEWRKKGVEIPALGQAPLNRIFPHYGVFSPVRGEYIALLARAPLPSPPGAGEALTAFDIGTGTGVLSAVLVRRGVAHVVATDQDPRALACASANLAQLGVADRVQVIDADLFPPGRASIVVCNPPWLPAKAGAPIERSVYDEGSRMLLGFLAGLAAHLAPNGEGWLILSDLAEHLGLRTRQFLLDAMDASGLRVLERMDARPVHPRASDATDALHTARAQEITSLWRLGVKPA